MIRHHVHYSHVWEGSCRSLILHTHTQHRLMTRSTKTRSILSISFPFFFFLCFIFIKITHSHTHTYIKLFMCHQLANEQEKKQKAKVKSASRQTSVSFVVVDVVKLLHAGAVSRDDCCSLTSILIQIESALVVFGAEEMAECDRLAERKSICLLYIVSLTFTNPNPSLLHTFRIPLTHHK
jgi:hypothetical protein